MNLVTNYVKDMFFMLQAVPEVPNSFWGYYEHKYFGLGFVHTYLTSRYIFTPLCSSVTVTQTH